MKLFEIQNAIAKGNFSLAELNDLQSFIAGVKTSSAKASLKVGDAVWVVQKTKRTPGVIESIKVKKAIVDMRGSRYNVPLSMIEAQ
tara:strand:+ start:876 stop:1133 length:258 start_codon:yes stop_codon:yes gene_type:complete